MKILLLPIIVILLASCQPSLEQRIGDLHSTSLKSGDEAAMLLGELVQMRNSINVQGRALTVEEIAFTGKVDDLESMFTQWTAALDALGNARSNKIRLEKELSLGDEISAWLDAARELSAAPEH